MRAQRSAIIITIHVTVAKNSKSLERWPQLVLPSLPKEESRIRNGGISLVGVSYFNQSLVFNVVHDPLFLTGFPFVAFSSNVCACECVSGFGQGDAKLC